MPWDALNGGAQALVQRRLIPTTAAEDFIDDPLLNFCDGEVPGAASFKLTGRSVWNTRWVLIIPGSELQGADPAAGVDFFINNVGDIKLLMCSYGYSGCTARASNQEDSDDDGLVAEPKSSGRGDSFSLPHSTKIQGR